jgi:predicted nucleic acid-binding Zn ribbon protein
MRRRNTETIRDVIEQFLKQKKLDKPLFEKKIIDAWPEVLGKNIMNYTSNLAVKNRKLYVSITSSVLRHDLFISRDNIVESLNKHVGSHVIDEIVFR